MAEGLLDKIGNGLLFNLSWLAIVASESVWIALPVALAHLCVHQFWLGLGWREMRFIAALTAIGLVLDQCLFAIGVFTLDGQPSYAPLWLGCLWPVMATTLNHAFAALQRHPGLAAVAGALGGLGSYYAGTAMTAVDFASPVYGPVGITLLWALLFPALALMARATVMESVNETRLA